MKSLLFLSLGMVTATMVRSQVIVMGKVKDIKGRILAGSSVSIKQTYDGGLTDSIGNYSFKSWEKGNQTLIVKSIGFKTQEQTIFLDRDSIEVNFIMKEEISELKA
ncbi:MAG: carboxypeptidase-like regulatory domain-containing protein, partial [Bacteroidota bacterium]